MKSNAISKVRAPSGIGDVVSPRAVGYSVTCQEGVIHGVRARRTLPTICVHRCSVAYVSCQASSGSAGHGVVSDMAGVLRTRPRRSRSRLRRGHSERQRLRVREPVLLAPGIAVEALRRLVELETAVA